MKRWSTVVLASIILVLPWSAPLLAQVIPDPQPSDPSNLVTSGAFSGVSVNSVNLAWQDNSDADAGFIVEVKSGSNTWTPIAYTPNGYITLYSQPGYSVLGYYSGLTAGSTKTFRVRAKYTGAPASAPSNTKNAVMPQAPTCTTPPKVTPVPTLRAHVGFPIDLVVAKNMNEGCPQHQVGYEWCLLSGPSGLTVDFNGGLVTWTPAPGTPASNPVSIGVKETGDPCTVAEVVAKTDFTILVDDNTMAEPLFRDYRSEASVVSVTGRAYQDFASYALHSSPLCTVYDGVSCPLVEEVPPSTTPVGPQTSALGDWDISSYEDGSRRLLSLIVQSPTNQNSAIYNPVIIDRTSYNSNWPKRLPLGSVRGALAVDIDLDGSHEIIASSRDSFQGGPWVWSIDGTLMWQAPGSGSVTESEVAAGDVDGDSLYEVVTASQSKLRVFRYDGELLGEVQVTPPTIFSNGGASLADLDGDRDLEILINTTDGTNGAKTHIYKYTPSGFVTYSAEWPKTMEYESASSRPSTADLNGDGYLDVVVDNHQYVYAWSADSSHPFPAGWWPGSRVELPAPLYPLAQHVNGVANANGFAQPAITPDIIVVGQNVISPSGTYLRCLNGGVCVPGTDCIHQGVCANASTKLPAAVGMSAAIGAFVPSAPGPEILLGGYVFSSDASVSAPILTLGGGTGVGLSTIVDAGLEGTYALMGTMDQSQFTANISSFESDGSVDDEYPKALYGNTNCGSAPQLGDFDGDGQREVLVEITDATYGAVVAVYRTSWDETEFKHKNNPWPMAGHDPQRTGRSTCKFPSQACSVDSNCCSGRCFVNPFDPQDKKCQ